MVNGIISLAWIALVVLAIVLIAYIAPKVVSYVKWLIKWYFHD